ncbi:hypothetical protein BDV32DRAFT_133519 [Aspergillus pseudonomiae]|nr:hypothetical protein BDV32DRAFT_133519 [Aspergillus pseudonomiae]
MVGGPVDPLAGSFAIFLCSGILAFFFFSPFPFSMAPRLGHNHVPHSLYRNKGNRFATSSWVAKKERSHGYGHKFVRSYRIVEVR